MPNPPPKSYGAPTGPQASVQTQRPRVGAADPATIHSRLDAYEKHILAEHAKIQHARTVVPRAPTQPSANANRRSGLNYKVEKGLKDAGA